MLETVEQATIGGKRQDRNGRLQNENYEKLIVAISKWPHLRTLTASLVFAHRWVLGHLGVQFSSSWSQALRTRRPYSLYPEEPCLLIVLKISFLLI